MSRAPDETNPDCTHAAERLPALAGGGLAPDEAAALERHVAGCAPCAVELRALRETLDRLRHLPAGPEKDPRFWINFERGVRLAYDARTERRRFGARLGRLVFAFAAAASVVLGVRLAAIGPARGPADAGTAPAVAAPQAPGQPPGIVHDPIGIDETDLDPEEIIDHLSTDDLTLVGKALGEGA